MLSLVLSLAPDRIDDTIILRGIGPSLSGSGLSGVLADPTLELRNSDGGIISSNNNWQDDAAQAAIISKAGVAPTDPLESGIVTSLAPGSYTALLAGSDGGVGIG